MRRCMIAAALAAAAILPAAAAAHTGTVACDGTVVSAWPGGVAELTPDGYVITWPDGHVQRNVPGPQGCSVTPPPPPVVIAPTPPPVVIEPTPPVQADPAPPPAPVTKLKVRKRVFTIAVFGCPRERAYVIRRTIVTWSRGGVAVRIKVSKPRRHYLPGRCVTVLPPVAG